MTYNIENDDFNLYCSFEDYAQPYITELENDIVRKRKAKYQALDTYQFIDRDRVLEIINENFAGRISVKYSYCGHTAQCDITHDGHLLWKRIGPCEEAA